jgi:hypothetical protein
MAKRVLTKIIFCGTGITKNGNDRPTRFVMTAFNFQFFVGHGRFGI